MSVGIERADNLAFFITLILFVPDPDEVVISIGPLRFPIPSLSRFGHPVNKNPSEMALKIFKRKNLYTESSG
ncbi:MAG: hypothetical protein H6684_12930 [Deltaproteobacteria bacterium]|nr:hypothetical protein [Deltaproteobacteria bacterium]MCB9489629.1 hypothetical protein [Deltaproteobacteria bacterium]